MLRTFRRLRWRMTFSYIAVTLPSLVLIQFCCLLVMGAIFYAFLNSQALAEDQARALAGIAHQAEPYLGATPDRAGLGRWLAGTMCGGADAPTMFPPDTHPAVLLAAVVDPVGRVLADPTGTLSAGGALAPALDPRSAAVLRAALGGQTDPRLLAVRQPDNAVVAAAPILDSQRRVLGAWLVRVGPTPLPSRNETLIVLLVFLVPTSLVASLFAIGFGALYGHLTSRALVRRLRGLAVAADAWSTGDFTAAAPDRSGDELGHLSRRLNQMAGQLRSLVVTRQELATLEERNRLARDLHDSVKQQLFAISMQLASARTVLRSQPAADALLVQAEELTRGAQQEVTATVHALRPAALQQGALVDSLRAYLAAWSRRHAIRAEIRSHGRCALPPEREQILFRVAQEALANVARHSGAAEVMVTMRAEATAVVAMIADDGCGFDPPAALRRGVGLHSMRERLAAGGGSLEIDSQPGRGARITARLPLSEELGR